MESMIVRKQKSLEKEEEIAAAGLSKVRDPTNRRSQSGDIVVHVVTEDDDFVHVVIEDDEVMNFGPAMKRPSLFRFISSIDQRCIALINLCGPTALPKLKQVHAFSLRRGAAFSDQDVAKHLVYALVSDTDVSPANIAYARKVFGVIREPTNVFTWNAMIKGYSEGESPSSAVEFYQEMVGYGVRPDTHTYPFVLKAIARLANLRDGEKVHSSVVRSGFESLVFVGNALIHMYACCGKVEIAHKMFERMPYRDLVAWNTVINGFASNGMPNEALTLFSEMGLDGMSPDGFTVVSMLTTCAEMGALALGRRVHVYMLKVGLIENLHASNSLLDMYAKSGCVWEAKMVFDEMRARNVVSWTCLIVGLAVNGNGFEALELFKEMERKDLVPSQITFVGVLYACSHCKMVDEGFEYFRRMEEEFRIAPLIEHYGCMVDLLSRAGLVKRAYEFIKSMPIRPNAVIWRTLLSACTTRGDLALAETVRAELIELEPNHSGDYVLLSNLYARSRRWSDVHKVRREMVSDGIHKFPGYSLVELGNLLHEFTTGDTSHPQSDAIHTKLAEITKSLRLEGYVPHTRNVFADIEDEEKEFALSYHSEKIAVAFVLVNTGPGVPIRVVKNLRICTDCHLAIKLISKIYDREIVVRDRSRFHHFRNGECSCMDYW